MFSIPAPGFMELRRGTELWAVVTASSFPGGFRSRRSLPKPQFSRPTPILQLCKFSENSSECFHLYGPHNPWSRPVCLGRCPVNGKMNDFVEKHCELCVFPNTPLSTSIHRNISLPASIFTSLPLVLERIVSPLPSPLNPTPPSLLCPLHVLPGL